jgi:hypothetical protein
MKMFGSVPQLSSLDRLVPKKTGTSTFFPQLAVTAFGRVVVDLLAMIELRTAHGAADDEHAPPSPAVFLRMVVLRMMTGRSTAMPPPRLATFPEIVLLRIVVWVAAPMAARPPPSPWSHCWRAGRDRGSTPPGYQRRLR